MLAAECCFELHCSNTHGQSFLCSWHPGLPRQGVLRKVAEGLVLHDFHLVGEDVLINRFAHWRLPFLRSFLYTLRIRLIEIALITLLKMLSQEFLALRLQKVDLILFDVSEERENPVVGLVNRKDDRNEDDLREERETNTANHHQLELLLESVVLAVVEIKEAFRDCDTARQQLHDTVREDIEVRFLDRSNFSVS